MKINLTTTTIGDESPARLTIGALRRFAKAGVYRCVTHQDRFPSERFIKTDRGLVCTDVYDSKAEIHPVPDSWCTECQFILAPEQVVNITFEKEKTVPEATTGGCFLSPATPAAAPVPVFIPHGVKVPGATGPVIAGFRVPADSDQYVAFQLASGLKVGDKVRVCRTARSHEGGWSNTWAPKMSLEVGKVVTIAAFNSRAWGVRFDGDSFNWPFFVLEKVS